MTNPRVKLSRDQIYRLLDGHPVQLATSVGLLEVEGVSNAWIPLQQIPTDTIVIAMRKAIGSDVPVEVWANPTYEVIVTRGDVTHLSIKRYDRAPIRNWRHFQQMKNEICGETAEAVELYPSEARIADNANQYHLWVMPPGVNVGLGWPEGMVADPSGDAPGYSEQSNAGRQEPWEDGLTTGGKMKAAGADDVEAARDIIRAVTGKGAP